MELNELAAALRSNGANTAKLQGLDEDYAAAQALRGSNLAQVNQYGTVSPLAVFADVLNRERGARDTRLLKPQREQLRTDIAEGNTVLPLYTASKQEEATKQAQTNFETTTANTLAAAQAEAEAKLAADVATNKARLDAANAAADGRRDAARIAADAAGNALGTPEAWAYPDGSGLVTGYPTKGGGLRTATGTPLDLTGRVPYKNPSTLNKEQNKALATLAAEAPTRLTAIDKGVKLLKAFNSGAKSGTTRGILNALPGQFTDQAAFDQELDSYAEQAARAALKAAGEIRPTDADVEGAKKSLFGVAKGEQVNKNLITEYLKTQIAVENSYRRMKGEPLLEMPSVEGVGDEWYNTLFEQSAGNPTEISGASAPVTATGVNGQKLQLINNQWVPM